MRYATLMLDLHSVCLRGYSGLEGHYRQSVCTVQPTALPSEEELAAAAGITTSSVLVLPLNLS